MNKSFSSLWSALGMLVFVFLLFTVASVSRADEVDDAVTKAVVYLKGQPVTPDITMALVAAGETVDVSYLKSFSGATAIEYAKPIMAIVAAGENPSTYPTQDLVAKLKSFADSAQLGSASQVNDDIWGILAFSSAGVQSSDSVIQNSKAFILANQNADDGWAWNTGGTSDTNDTAVAIMALLQTGMAKSDSSIQKAIAYLKGAQNTDVGFPYDPVSPFGTDSDANSDAWVIAAINKLGEDPKSASWRKDENNPVAHLLSLQDADGGFWWMQPPADFNNKGATADAVIALSGKSFPVASSGGGNSSDSSVFYRIVGSSGEICKGGVKATTAMEVVVLAASDCNYTYEIKDFSFGKFLSRINNDAAEGLKGWLYRVDGVLPNVGAADFALSGGEHVLWYYGESDDPPPALGDVSDSVDLAVEVISSGSDGGGTPEVAFTVNPSSVNFGKLIPGSSAMGQVTLKNEGQKNLNIKAEIAGNAVFNFLKIESVLWNLFETLLSAGAQKNVGLQLSLPSGFNSFGQKQGTLIFWGTVQ